jgi:hypothetical protein
VPAGRGETGTHTASASRTPPSVLPWAHRESRRIIRTARDPGTTRVLYRGGFARNKARIRLDGPRDALDAGYRPGAGIVKAGIT